LARIEQAKADWKRYRFNVVVPGDNKEFHSLARRQDVGVLPMTVQIHRPAKKGGREDFARLPTLGPDTGALVRR
jgi:hypothetical protein